MGPPAQGGNERVSRGPRRERAAHRFASVLALQVLLFSAVVRADPQEPPWEFSLTPYLWLPRVDASMRYETPGSGGSAVSMTNLLQHLNAAFFLSGEARKGRWGLASDLVFCDFRREGSNVTTVGGPGGESEVPINSGTTTTLTGYMVSVTGNYSLSRSPDAKLDLLAGVRYTHVGTTLDWSFTTSVDSLAGRTGSVGRVSICGTALWVCAATPSSEAGSGSYRITWMPVRVRRNSPGRGCLESVTRSAGAICSWCIAISPSNRAMSTRCSACTFQALRLAQRFASEQDTADIAERVSAAQPTKTVAVQHAARCRRGKLTVGSRDPAMSGVGGKRALSIWKGSCRT